MKENEVLNFFKSLGFDRDEAIIFLILIKFGSSTILEISRRSGIPRTQVYRKIEHLKDLGLIEEIIQEHRKLYKSAKLNRFQYLIQEKEDQIEELKNNYILIKDIFNAYPSISQTGTKVLFYKGSEGIKQMVWNVLDAEKEVVGYSYRALNEIVGDDFMKNFKREFIFKNLSFRDLYSDQYNKTKNKDKYRNDENRHFISKYVPSPILNIDHQIDIYNNVYAIYNWFEGDVFGVEIYNDKVTNLQKQIFEILWKSNL